MSGSKWLLTHFTTGLREMVGDQLALAGVCIRPGDAWADLANLLEVSERALAVDRCRGCDHRLIGLRGSKPMQKRDSQAHGQAHDQNWQDHKLEHGLEIVARTAQ